MTSALVLDFGEVLVRPQSHAAISEMAAIAGLGTDEFHRRYWQHRPAYDCGLPADEYWQLVLNDSRMDPADVRRVTPLLKDADARSWTDYREEMWQLTSDFRTRGGRTAFLSNGVPEVMERVRRQRDLAAYFDVVIVSYEVGFAKPDRRIYELCLSRLGVAPAEALFVDDRIPNVEAARTIGISAIVFLGDESVDEIGRLLA